MFWVHCILAWFAFNAAFVVLMVYRHKIGNFFSRRPKIVLEGC